MPPRITDELVGELFILKPSQQREVLKFTHFLRIKARINPAQAYFWTRKWQQLERKAKRAKAHGKKLGNGTVKGLLRALKSKS
jgi:hypothetical protein